MIWLLEILLILTASFVVTCRAHGVDNWILLPWDPGDTNIHYRFVVTTAYPPCTNGVDNRILEILIFTTRLLLQDNVDHRWTTCRSVELHQKLNWLMLHVCACLSLMHERGH